MPLFDFPGHLSQPSLPPRGLCVGTLSTAPNTQLEMTSVISTETLEQLQLLVQLNCERQSYIFFAPQQNSFYLFIYGLFNGSVNGKMTNG
jgi:hypothetical protein